MKRKLNENDEPEEVDASQKTPVSFGDFNLDPRLLQAITKEKYASPTPVQAKAVPLALEGRDVLARSKTGSGKTLAYLLPILQSILQRSTKTSTSRSTSALILVPTRELASQVTKVVTQLSSFCAKHVHAVNLTPQIHDQAQRALLASAPDIVIATPARAASHLSTSTLIADNLSYLVIDEADLVLSYGYEADFKNIVDLIPKGIQTFLASATLTAEVDSLKGIFCRDPVIVDLQDEEKDSKNLNQYIVKCGEDEKFVLLFALFKLKLIKGKCIVFVGDVDRCYRVKLFLEQFGIKSCVLNSELPVNCRIHVVEEFNKNVYDIIIATDENEVVEGIEKLSAVEEEKKGTPAEANQENGDSTTSSTQPAKTTTNGTRPPKKKSKQHHKKDKEYGISRGIDFHAVTCVLNFDLPSSAKSYTHRIGRTARANRSGIALSFVIPKDRYRKDRFTSFAGSENDEATIAAIIAAQAEKNQEVQPYNFDMKKLEGFRYRVSSALKVVSPGAIREARIRELRQEMLKSEKLKRHLEENPDDERFLRHDGELRPAKVKAHLKHVPDYLMPNGGAVKDVGFVGLDKERENKIRKARARNKFRGKRGRSNVKNDPLKTFNAKGRGK